MRTMNQPGATTSEIASLHERIAELEEHAKTLLVAERRACEAKHNLGQQLQLLHKVNDLGKILSAARSPGGMLDETVDFVVREFSYEMGFILLLDGSLKTISVAAKAGGSEFTPKTIEVKNLKQRESLLWTALEENHPVVVEQGLPEGDPITAFGLETLLIVPLGIESSIPMGAMILGNTLKRGVYYRQVQGEDAALLLTIARQVAFMLDKMELYEHLQREKEELERAEMELLSANENLENRVREKTQALQVSMEKLEESKLRLEQYSRELEVKVEERTRRLRESEQIYRSVMANSKAGMAVYRAGVILEVNPALTEIVGEPLEGADLSRLVERVTGPERRKELECYLKDSESGAANREGNFEVQAMRGEQERVWNVSAFPLASESGLCGFLVVDTTESRRVEEQLFGSQKMASLGNLAGGIAHEFNNILVGILGNASLLRMRAAGRSEIGGLAEMIETSALRAAELVQQLLGFARKGKYSSELLDINAVVTETLGLARRSFGPRIEMVLDLAPDLCPVEGDVTQIQQAIMNLALNAREAIGDEGTLVARTRCLDLDASAARGIPGLSAGQWAEIEITDSGRGMDADLQKMIFEPFFSTKESGGTGLGLPMVYGIVTNHGGTVQVRSRPGEGTSVVIYLPAGQQARARGRDRERARGDEGTL